MEPPPQPRAKIHMAEDNTLSVAMLLMEKMHNFKRSPRKWKEKLKEWNFEKNLSRDEMKILVAKAERRSKEAHKETIFFHYGNMIPPTKVTNWQRRIAATALTPASPSTQTPASIAYFTPQYSNQWATPKHAPVAEHTAVASTRMDTHFHQFFIIRPTQTTIVDEVSCPKPKVNDCRLITDDPFGGDRLLLFGLHPLSGTASFKYRQLKTTHDNLTCRFGDDFMRLLFESESTTEFVSSVGNSLRVSGPSLPIALCLDLLGLLGQTLIANDVDDEYHERALAVATTIGYFINFPHVSSTPCREHILGWWLHCGGLYEKSLPFLELAFMFDIEETSHLRSRPSYPPLSAADILHKSYQKLAPTHEWRAISDRLLGYTFYRLKEKLGFGDLATSVASEPESTCEITDYIENHLAAVLVHIFHPMQTAEIYCFLASRHLNCLHFQRRASCLLSALESATSVEMYQCCSTRIRRFLISLTPVCEKLAREGLKGERPEVNSVNRALKISIRTVVNLLPQSKDSAWGSILCTLTCLGRGLISDLEQVEEMLSDVWGHIPSEKLSLILLRVCNHRGRGKDERIRRNQGNG